MKYLFFAFTIAVVMATATSHAVEIDGTMLKRICNPDNKNAEEVGICKGLLTGVVSSFNSWPYCEVEIEGGVKILAPFCDGECEAPVTINSPTEMNITQVTGIVVKYLAGHPENLHSPAYWIARQALHEAFGVKKM